LHASKAVYRLIKYIDDQEAEREEEPEANVSES
jgi:hypothetical protein